MSRSAQRPEGGSKLGCRRGKRSKRAKSWRSLNNVGRLVLMPEEDSSIKRRGRNGTRPSRRPLSGAERRGASATTSGIEIKRLYDSGVTSPDWMTQPVPRLSGEYPFIRAFSPRCTAGGHALRQYGPVSAPPRNPTVDHLLVAFGRLRPADTDGPRPRPSAGPRRGRPRGRRDELADRHADAARGTATGQDFLHFDEPQCHGAPSCWRCTWWWPKSRACRGTGSTGPSRGARHVHDPLRPSMRIITDIFEFAPTAEDGTRFRFLATTSARPA